MSVSTYLSVLIALIGYSYCLERAITLRNTLDRNSWIRGCIGCLIIGGSLWTLSSLGSSASSLAITFAIAVIVLALLGALIWFVWSIFLIKRLTLP